VASTVNGRMIEVWSRIISFQEYWGVIVETEFLSGISIRLVPCDLHCSSISFVERASTTYHPRSYLGDRVKERYPGYQTILGRRTRDAQKLGTSHGSCYVRGGNFDDKLHFGLTFTLLAIRRNGCSHENLQVVGVNPRPQFVLCTKVRDA
jgi:hypothetical protein